ncbi:MAG: hypothetical protein ACTHPS_06245 [Streptosporangiaceae bacterium]
MAHEGTHTLASAHIAAKPGPPPTRGQLTKELRWNLACYRLAQGL